MADTAINMTLIMATKMGQKRSEVKAYPMKRSRIKPVSKKQAKENMELRELVICLRELCHNKSELSGESTGVFNAPVEPHHLAGRGKNLVNPFTICMLTRAEHIEEQKHMSYEHKQELLSKIKTIRLAQGFREVDYQ